MTGLTPALDQFSTGEMRVSSELDRSLSLLRATLEATADGLLVVSDKGAITSYNRRFTEIWGLPEDVMATGKDIEALSYAVGQLKDPDTFTAKVRGLYADPNAESFDILEFRDGRIIERYSRPQKIANRTVGRVWSFRDITERRRAEQELRESEERFRGLAEAAVDGILIHQDGFVLDANPSLLRMLGYELDELVGINVLDVLVAPEWRDVVGRNMRAGSTARYEIEGIRKDGSRIAIEISGRSAMYRGQRARVVAIHDVTERKRAEEGARRLMEEQAARTAAEEAARRARFLAEASRVLDTSFDYHTTLAMLARLAVPEFADFCTVFVREADETISGVGVAHVDPEKELLLRELVRVYVSRVDDGIAANPAVRAFRDGSSTLIPEITDEGQELLLLSGEHRALIEQLRPRSLMVVPLRVGDRILGVLTLSTGESDRHYGPDDLALAEELARRASLAVENARLFNAAGQATRDRDEMMAIVAHDLRNPLSTMSMAAQFLLDISGSEKTVERRNLEVIRRAADRMNRLIGDLLDVKRIESGRLTIEARPEDVIVVVCDAVEMVRPLANSSSLRLRPVFEKDLPRVLVDPARIQQVLSNLIGNAIKFTPSGGSITVRAASAPDGVRIAITDTGPGIAAEQLPHIFGRFWQGRRTDRRGLGLGLAIAKAIVEAHGGRIWVESQPGAGSTFFFTVPAESLPSSTTASSVPTALSSQRPESEATTIQ
jgi:PAS domain S-box-containing protein